MRRVITLSFFFLLLAATTPALAGSASHQGEASAANALFQWSTGPFSVKPEKTVQLGKAGRLTCSSAKGCILHIVLDITVLAKKDGALDLGVEADNGPTNPENSSGSACYSNEACNVSAQQTVVVSHGAHKIEYSVITNFTGEVISWSGQAQMYP